MAHGSWLRGMDSLVDSLVPQRRLAAGLPFAGLGFLYLAVTRAGILGGYPGALGGSVASSRLESHNRLGRSEP